MKDYEIKGITLNEREMSQICRYYEIQCIVEYITTTYPNLFSESEKELIADIARDKMNDYHLSESEAVREALEIEGNIVLKRNVRKGNSYKTFQCEWSDLAYALENCYPDLVPERFGIEATPEMCEVVYKWLVEEEFIEE